MQSRRKVVLAEVLERLGVFPSANAPDEGGGQLGSTRKTQKNGTVQGGRSRGVFGRITPSRPSVCRTMGDYKCNS